MEEKNTEQRQFKKTPVTQVRKIVFFAILMVAVLSFLWHDLGMLEAREDARQKELAQEEKISKLTLYRDSLAVTPSTTISTKREAP